VDFLDKYSEEYRANFSVDTFLTETNAITEKGELYNIDGNGSRVAQCTPLNISSWKLMEKIGLKREAELRQNVLFYTDNKGNPMYWDTYIYGALSSDKWG
jgi:hypothetical protein